MTPDLAAWREGLRRWLAESATGLPPGRFRFCLRGNRVPTVGPAAGFVTCFAMKAAWQSGLWESWPEAARRGCVDFVARFQQPTGYFVDPWVCRGVRGGPLRRMGAALAGWLPRRRPRDGETRVDKAIRAETRQALSALRMVGASLPFGIPVVPGDPASVRDFLDRLDWRNPWAAGSHAGHLLCFLGARLAEGSGTTREAAALEAILEFLAGIRDAHTGCWYRGNVADAVRINGAMKILSGLQWVDRPAPDCRALLDYALAQPFQRDGCGFLNRLYVVHEARRGVPPGHREAEVRAVAEAALAAIGDFRQADGGFAFTPHAVQQDYSGSAVSGGGRGGDMHGAVMLTWAAALACRLGGARLPGSGDWRPHRP